MRPGPFGRWLEVMRPTTSSSPRARGLTNRAVNFGTPLKNTLVPVITGAGSPAGADRFRHRHGNGCLPGRLGTALPSSPCSFPTSRGWAAYLHADRALWFVLINLTSSICSNFVRRIHACVPKAGGAPRGGTLSMGTRSARWRDGLHRVTDSDSVELQVLADDGDRGGSTFFIRCRGVLSPCWRPHTPFESGYAQPSATG